MKKLRQVRAAFAAVAVTAGVACALTIPASPAVAYYSGGLFLDITAQSPGTLVAKGAAVEIPIEYTCNAQNPFLQVSVSQRVDSGDLATGSASVQVACSGAHDHTVITVPASGTKAFVKGNAFVSANISGCLSNFTNCGAEHDDATVKFRR
jgi:hypothetical protein